MSGWTPQRHQTEDGPASSSPTRFLLFHRSLLQLLRRAERLVHDGGKLLHLVVQQQVLQRKRPITRTEPVRTPACRRNPSHPDPADQPTTVTGYRSTTGVGPT